MNQSSLLAGTIHQLPDDLKTVILSQDLLISAWNQLTPIARDEWICWVTIVKMPSTRRDHLRRVAEDLSQGKKRPCCWPGCPHRRPQAAKWFGKKH